GPGHSGARADVRRLDTGAARLAGLCTALCGTGVEHLLRRRATAVFTQQSTDTVLHAPAAGQRTAAADRPAGALRQPCTAGAEGSVCRPVASSVSGCRS